MHVLWSVGQRKECTLLVRDTKKFFAEKWRCWSQEQNEYMHFVEKLLMIMCNTYIWDGYIFRLSVGDIKIVTSKLKSSEMNLTNLDAIMYPQKNIMRFHSLINTSFFNDFHQKCSATILKTLFNVFTTFAVV